MHGGQDPTLRFGRAAEAVSPRLSLGCRRLVASKYGHCSSVYACTANQNGCSASKNGSTACQRWAEVCGWELGCCCMTEHGIARARRGDAADSCIAYVAKLFPRRIKGTPSAVAAHGFAHGCRTWGRRVGAAAGKCASVGVVVAAFSQAVYRELTSSAVC